MDRRLGFVCDLATSVIPGKIAFYDLPKFRRAEAENYRLKDLAPPIYCSKGIGTIFLLEVVSSAVAYNQAIASTTSESPSNSILFGALAGFALLSKGVYSNYLNNMRRQMESENKERDSISSLEAVSD